MNEINPQDPESQGRKNEPQQENAWLEIGKTLITAIILALGIRTFIAEARYIPSTSMVPTLLVDDRLIIEKVSYRFQKPQRGDIVVFYPPNEATTACIQRPMGSSGQNIPNLSVDSSPTNTQVPAANKTKDAYIKRIVGIPGDRVEVKNGRVYRNGEVIRESYIKEAPDYDFASVIVPENQYLVFGDNRNNSCDSHLWGFVPHDNIIGKAVVRFWPLDRLGGIESDSVYADDLKK
jgi:signal peptidase I